MNYSFKTTVEDLKTSLEFSQNELSEGKNQLKTTEGKIGVLEIELTGLRTMTDRMVYVNTDLQDQLTNVEAR